MMNTAEFVKTVREIVIQVINSLKPAKLMTGTVKNINPLEVFVDQRLTLTEDFLIVPKHLKAGYTFHDSDGRKIYSDCTLKENDKVIVIRDYGGQKFYIAEVVQ